jgi:hypothetical protein
MAYKIREINPEDAYKIQDDFGIKERGYGGLRDGGLRDTQQLIFKSAM